MSSWFCSQGQPCFGGDADLIAVMLPRGHARSLYSVDSTGVLSLFSLNKSSWCCSQGQPCFGGDADLIAVLLPRGHARLDRLLIDCKDNPFIRYQSAPL